MGITNLSTELYLAQGLFGIKEPRLGARRLRVILEVPDLHPQHINGDPSDVELLSP